MSDGATHTVVCSVVAGPTGVEASLDPVTDPARIFADWRRSRPKPFLPVAAIEISPESFEDITTWKLPCRLSVSRAAAVFRTIGIPQDSARAFARQYVHLGADARPLLRAWAEAVD